MAATTRHQEELKKKAEKALLTATDPIEKLRASCLARGANGIRGLARLFNIMDDDGSKKLNFDEFKKGIQEYGLGFSKEEIKDMFFAFDTDKSGQVDFDEFLIRLRPAMGRSRVDLINKAFNKLDKNGDGQITSADLKGVYSVRNHPKYLNGEWSEEQVFNNFLKVFDTRNEEDGIITREEFINYYAGVSASIDNDAYFDLMMRTNWKI